MNSIPAWVRVGAGCVCIDATPSYLNGARLTLNRTYVVEAVKVSNGVGLVLACAPHSGHPVSGGWNVNRFRPAVSTKTQAQDVAHFTHWLHSKEPADA